MAKSQDYLFSAFNDLKGLWWSRSWHIIYSLGLQRAQQRDMDLNWKESFQMSIMVLSEKLLGILQQSSAALFWLGWHYMPSLCGLVSPHTVTQYFFGFLIQHDHEWLFNPIQGLHLSWRSKSLWPFKAYWSWERGHFPAKSLLSKQTLD